MATVNAIRALEEKDFGWTGSYTWRVENWTHITKQKIHSPEFEVGGYSWRLWVYPRSKDRQRTADCVGLYLNFPEAPFTPLRMCPKAKFVLTALNSKCPRQSRRLEAICTFTSKSQGWGFSRFLPIQQAQNAEQGFLVNDTLTLRVDIYIEEIAGILGKISRLETGCLGIKNYRETSLLTSLMQCLFHIKSIRRALFEIPILESTDSKKSVLVALQHLFYELQYWYTSVETKNLVKALQWDLDNMCLQHDVLEMQHVLFGKLSKDSRASNVMECISELFTGEYSTYIESLYLQDAPTFKQSYMEISLDVLDCTDIYASLEKLCQVQRLGEGNPRRRLTRDLGEVNQYMLSDSFPTVLQFHLKRCYCNPDCKAILKTNSYYKFYDELDLDFNDRVLLSKNADRTIQNKYKLHSVLVQRTGPGRGSYFAFIRRHEKWYKFDNEVVKEVSAEEAINAQFGDKSGTLNSNFSKKFECIDKSAAVMLMYIRKSDWNRVMCETRNESIPEPIRKRFYEEQMEKTDQQKEKQEAHLYVNIKLATEFHFARQTRARCYFDLADFDTAKNYRIYKKTPFADFQEMVGDHFGIPQHLQRFWHWTRRTSNTRGVAKPLIKGPHDLKTVLDLRHFADKTSPADEEDNALMTIKLFLESPEKASVIENKLRAIQRNEVFIFLKYFDPESSRLSYLGHMFVEMTSQFHLVFEKAKKMARLSRKDKVIGIREVKDSPTVICSDLVPSSTPRETKLFQGDTIIIQKVATTHQYEFPTVKSFLEIIQYTKTINFRPLNKPTDEGFELELLVTITYQQVTNELAKHLQVDDPKKLRLTQHNIDTQMPAESPIKYKGMVSLKQMICQEGKYAGILYYEVLDMQLPYLESLRCFTVGFHDEKGKQQSEHKLTLSKDKKVSHLVKALKAELSETYKGCDMRIMQIFSSEVYEVFDRVHDLELLYGSHWIYRAEVIPEDQKNLKLEEFLVLFYHSKRDDNRLTDFGDSFWFKVKLGETVREVKARIQETLEIPDENFNQWIAAYHSRSGHTVEYLEDDDEILAKFPRMFLGGVTYRKYVGDSESFIVLQH